MDYDSNKVKTPAIKIPKKIPTGEKIELNLKGSPFKFVANTDTVVGL